MTFRFCDALTIVGERVSDSSGSTIAAKKLPIASARATASCGESGASPVTVFRRAVTSGISCWSGTCSPSFVIRGAAFTSALSAMPGIDAWPERPCTVAELEALAGSLVDQVVAPNRVRVGLAQPLGAEARADLLVGGRSEDEIAGGLEAFTGERGHRDCARGDLALHVERAASPDLAVSQLAAERVRRPLRRIRQYHVGVREKQQAGTVASTGQASNEVRALWNARVELALGAALLEIHAEQLRGSGFVPRRVRRVHTDELLEKLGDLVADGDGRHQSSSSFARAVSWFRARQSAGKKLWWIIFPSTSTGVPCVPTTWSPMIRATTL